ncbi:MAG TPA: enolase C-terminal domain-like protein [Propionibacteriaceae bacterium]|nr:enolase C-terminal domain-like protein [Propionibacteriaceae bacterium]
MTSPDTSLGAPEGTPAEVAIDAVRADAFTIPLEHPESDGTFRWDATTIVIASVTAGGRTGIGYSYAPAASAALITDHLADVVTGRDPMAIGAAWGSMVHAVRNIGRSGAASCAISAVDVALWDLKARLLERSVVDLLGGYHDGVPVYGSGGFTNLTDRQLTDQLSGWVDQGLRAVKIKVGTHPDDDPRRVELARGIIGDDVDLFVDGNGAYTRKQALALAERFAEFGVVWFEEPVSMDDLAGLRLLRDRAPAGMDIAAGEYGYDIADFRDLLAHEAVDCLQADVTRAGGITGVLRAAALADAETIDLSAHCAPQASAHAFTAVWHLRNLEYFADHVRLEHMVFDGVLEPEDGALHPDRSRPGLGLEVKWADIEEFRVHPGGGTT